MRGLHARAAQRSEQVELQSRSVVVQRYNPTKIICESLTGNVHHTTVVTVLIIDTLRCPVLSDQVTVIRNMATELVRHIKLIRRNRQEYLIPPAGIEIASVILTFAIIGYRDVRILPKPVPVGSAISEFRNITARRRQYRDRQRVISHANSFGPSCRAIPLFARHTHSSFPAGFLLSIVGPVRFPKFFLE